MMDETDPRVKALRDLAWGLQNRKNKPGSHLKEEYKRECGKLATRAVTMCSDIEYMAEDDFVARSAELTPLLHAKIKELGEVEEAEKEKKMGKCYRPAADGGGGGYVIGKKVVQPTVGSTCTSGELATNVIDGHGKPAITAQEVVARCTEDPEALWLSDVGIKDSDMKAVCEGLRRAGEELTSIDLSQNAIADAGVQALVTALAGGACPKLSQLWVGGNEFGDLGTQMFKGGLCTLRRSLVVHIDDSDGVASTSAVPKTNTTDAGPSESGAACVHSKSSESPPAEDPGSADALVSDMPQPADNRPVHCVSEQTAGPAAAQLDAVEPGVGGSSAAGTGVGATVSVDLLEGVGGDAATGSQSVRVCISLPANIVSSKELDLDISPQRVLLRLCTDRSVLADTELPCIVDPDSAEAAFSKRKRLMTVTLRASPS